MDSAFAEFLDRASGGEVEPAAYGLALELAAAMSASYADTATFSLLQATQRVLGQQHQGAARGGEQRRAEKFRALLQRFLVAAGPPRPITLEPASVCTVRRAWGFHWECVSAAARRRHHAISFMKD